MTKTTLSLVQEWLPRRGTNPHKYENGYVFGLIGSRSFPGAAVLSALAAARIGAGGVRCLVPESVWPVMAAHTIEVMLKSTVETDDGGLALEALSEIPSFTERCKAGWVGCGIDRNPETLALIRESLKLIQVPMVLDADALMAVDPTFINNHAKGQWILTPHEGEFQRLIGDVHLTLENRADILRDHAKAWNCVILLKGFPSLIAGPDGEFYENPTGSTAATTAGCGDVLAGICAGLLAQGLTPIHAAVVGMYLSGMASEAHQNTFGGHTLMASDLLDQIPHVLGKVYSPNKM
ncbi:MAG: NAD(P)H-hydrate dehydratase [Alphaproteobacteria bacterium]|nr:NAD(P)H-hydrate dehydratase [Alphaproteobacteria bacterium]